MVEKLTTGFDKPLGRPDRYPPPKSDTHTLEVLLATATESIAFIHVFPPRNDVSPTTFFGGTPLVPLGFQWPRSAVDDLPLSFLGQVDCSALPEVYGRSALPADGVLYFFIDWELLDGNDEAQQTKGYVKYASAPTGVFAEAVPPDDLPPMYGHNASYYYSWLEHTDRTTRDYPKTSPKIGMRMQKLLTFAEEHPGERDGNSAGRYKDLWQHVQTEELRRVYGAPAHRTRMFQAPDVMQDKGAVWRPFPSFPHAWLAVEMVCGELLERLERASRDLDRGRIAKRPDGSTWPAEPAAQCAIYNRVAAEAGTWIATARAKSLMTGPSVQDHTAFWAWLDSLNAAVEPSTTGRLHDMRSSYTLNRCIATWVNRACDECLMFSAASAALVPPTVVEEMRANHTPLVDGGSLAAGRHQMFGQGRNIQGAPDRMNATDVLLMQLDTDVGLAWMMGDCGAIQYWITPQDLHERRFEHVKVTMEGY